MVPFVWVINQISFVDRVAGRLREESQEHRACLDAGRHTGLIAAERGKVLVLNARLQGC
jgi:hypothetical protein